MGGAIMAIYDMEEKHFVEDIGLFFERMGLTRMAGRVLGVLLISEPVAQSLTQISEALEASKSAISTATRLLVEAELIEQVPSPLPRRDYFRFKPGGWVLFMGQQMRLYKTLHQITERGLELMKAKSPDLRERLQEAHDLFSSLETEYPTWLESVVKSRKIQR
jgi:DNA-binding transcriptional regulator GbsR (MarR family)